MSHAATIKLHDRTFRVMISAAEIAAAVEKMAVRVNADYADTTSGTTPGASPASDRTTPKPPLFLAVLNGSFMFMADLAKCIDFPMEVSFIKLASYSGTGSTGSVRELIGLTGSIEGRHVIVVEDIVDTGNSMEHLLQLLEQHRPASIEIATLLFKPAAYRKSYPVKYRGIDIGNEFIVGYGLDYNQLGRNLKDIYVVTDDE
jgi:hypoxanthine phosphoribosyltransferase